MEEKEEQISFSDVHEDFKDGNVHEEEWQGMPEFVQEDLTSFRSVIVHFRNEEDVQAFAELIGQTITPKQPSLWHPELKIRHRLTKRYVDES